ncbi:MAG: glycosyltransferase [Fimbriimonas ginsengisoli]|uniref:Glycosyltransferase n=1 Tax=Fimbriimonas ginsengisoli TaxID=1005039 RepID=A0A931LUQ5_FIMGI|nr:glycosyltransferase [Fimbriimonas ginsengisoli]
MSTQNGRTRVVGLADTVVGYGSPQIQRFMASLGAHHGVRATILEPEVKGRKSVHEHYPELDIETIRIGRQPYAWPPGRAEYAAKLAKRIDEIKPDVLVIFCTFCLPALLRAKHRPKKVVYYAIEMVEPYGDADVWLNAHFRDRFDVIVFPEHNRAARDAIRCWLLERPSVVMLNCANSRVDPEPILPATERNGRMISQGSIGYYTTFANYFLIHTSRSFPIDMFGPISGPDEMHDRIRKLRHNVQYKGIVDNKTLGALRRHYSWGIVTWNPGKENTLYAASNKFFEYIASGVPAITAPHPQHVQFVRQYGCGIVMQEWSYPSFVAAISEAMLISRSSLYADYVGACKKAAGEELNWEAQFDKFLAVYEGRRLGPTVPLGAT